MSRPYYYVPDAAGVPQPADDFLVWADWTDKSALPGSGETADYPAGRRVGKTVLPSGDTVSTVFLGIDHNWGGGPPVLFETMAYTADGSFYAFQDRYCTVEEARAGHARAVADPSVFLPEAEEAADTPAVVRTTDSCP